MRYIHSKYSVENIWNCEESPEKDSTKQHAQYANCMKEKQINNGQNHYTICNHWKTRTKSQKCIPINADTVKCFDKLWLKNCLIVMEEIGYNRNDIKMNKKAEILIDTTVGQSENISIEEIVKQ